MKASVPSQTKLYISGAKYKYDVTIPMDCEALRELLRRPVQAADETDADFAVRNVRFFELQRAHASAPSGKQPAPQLVSYLLCNFGTALGFFAVLAGPVLAEWLAGGKGNEGHGEHEGNEGHCDCDAQRELPAHAEHRKLHGHRDTSFLDLQS
eukprot:24302-Prymnesium_polylepis.1